MLKLWKNKTETRRGQSVRAEQSWVTQRRAPPVLCCVLASHLQVQLAFWSLPNVVVALSTVYAVCLLAFSHS